MRYVALLRGINVGGKGAIRMEDLRAIFAAAGARDVATYIASGNVIFEAPASALPAIRKKAQAKLQRILGEKAATVYRSASEVQAIARRDPFGGYDPVARDPFGRHKPKDKIGRYVLFFGNTPASKMRVPCTSETEACEVIGMHGLHAFVVSYRKRTGWYGFPNEWVERALGVVSTARTWNTVAKLAALTD